MSRMLQILERNLEEPSYGRIIDNSKVCNILDRHLTDSNHSVLSLKVPDSICGPNKGHDRESRYDGLQRLSEFFMVKQFEIVEQKKNWWDGVYIRVKAKYEVGWKREQCIIEPTYSGFYISSSLYSLFLARLRMYYFVRDLYMNAEGERQERSGIRLHFDVYDITEKEANEKHGLNEKIRYFRKLVTQPNDKKPMEKRALIRKGFFGMYCKMHRNEQFYAHEFGITLPPMRVPGWMYLVLSDPGLHDEKYPYARRGSILSCTKAESAPLYTDQRGLGLPIPEKENTTAETVAEEKNPNAAGSSQEKKTIAKSESETNSKSADGNEKDDKAADCVKEQQAQGDGGDNSIISNNIQPQVCEQNEGAGSSESEKTSAPTDDDDDDPNMRYFFYGDKLIKVYSDEEEIRLEKELYGFSLREEEIAKKRATAAADEVEKKRAKVDVDE